jgi:hypothetical protein
MAKPFMTAFLPIWLIGWAAGWILVITVLTAQLLGIAPESYGLDTGFEQVVGLYWLVMWTYGGISVTKLFLWERIGKEIIVFTRQSITYRRQLPGSKYADEYTAEHIRDLRVSPVEGSWREWHKNSRLRKSRMFWEFTDAFTEAGTIAFDYGARTIRFGSGLGTPEAQHIVFTITARFPQYGDTP